MSTTDRQILENGYVQSEQRRGVRPASVLRLLIRRSLVRAQVGEPITTGLAAMQGPFRFGPILERYWRLSNIQWFAALCLALSACGGSDEQVAPEPALLTTGQCTADGFAPGPAPDGPYPRCHPCPGATGYACPLQ